MGVRLALCSEPSSSATWNDSRVKSLTGDATISARFMRGDNFTFRARTRPSSLATTCRSSMRSPRDSPSDADGAVSRGLHAGGGHRYAGASAGESAWGGIGVGDQRDCRVGQRMELLRRRASASLTDDYLADEDGFGQWLEECCVRDPERRWSDPATCIATTKPGAGRRVHGRRVMPCCRAIWSAAGLVGRRPGWGAAFRVCASPTMTL